MKQMNGVCVWQLEFDAARGLAQAFHSLLEAGDLEGCTVERDGLSIRFTATIDRGEALVAAIYELGELRWCTRHPLRAGTASINAVHATTP